MKPPGPAPLLGLAAALALAGVAAALVSQHVFDMQPCAWCVLQRLEFLVAAALAALGAAAARLRLAAAVGVVAVATAGMASAAWQHFVAAASASCNLTLADRIVAGLGLDALLPEVFAAWASCADAAVDLLGVPYAFWSLALFAVLDALATLALVSAVRR